MKNYYYCTVDFEIGPITVVISDEGVEQIFLCNVGWETFRVSYQPQYDPLRCKEVVEQLKEYFQGKRQSFDVILAPRGTTFQKRVWEVLQQIPYGQVCTYGDVARVLEKPGAARAVGGANRANPIPIIIPCHRVVGGGGKIGGYMGTHTELKVWLLSHEQKGTKR